jgi:riboflavin kinase/FMN adenylyltransferase
VKERLLCEMGVEVLYVDSFAAVRELGPRAFVEEVLIGRLKAVCVVTGFNYTFGYKGAGDAKLLHEICAESGVKTIAIPKIEIDGVGVASRRIRREILGGNMKTAQKFLGRPFFIQERVIEGRRLGRKLGVPTINQRLPDPDHGGGENLPQRDQRGEKSHRRRGAGNPCRNPYSGFL